jgi:hypothetical protein
MTPSPAPQVNNTDDLRAQLARALHGAPKRVLVIKAVDDAAFAAILSTLQQVLPEAQLTSLVTGETRGAEEEVGEVLRPSMGRRALVRALRHGFDLCVVATGPEGIGGVRRVQADVAAWLAKVRQLVICNAGGVLTSRGRIANFLAPLGSLLSLTLGIVACVIWAAISLILIALIALVGEVIGRVLIRTK